MKVGIKGCNERGGGVSKPSDWGANCIGEADCKEPFNRIKPATTVQGLQDASQYLYHKRRWGASDLDWSVHRDCKALDRAGKADPASLWHSHEELVQIIPFSLIEDADAIPMGGSFSAQCADLHSVWALKVAVEKMRQLENSLRPNQCHGRKRRHVA